MTRAVLAVALAVAAALSVRAPARAETPAAKKTRPAAAPAQSPAVKPASARAPVAARRAAGAPEPAELPKKLAILADKRAQEPPTAAERSRHARRLRRRVGKRPGELLNVRNLWTRETLVLDARRGATVGAELFNRFLRCHFTNEPTTMDGRLLGVLVGAAVKFKRNKIQIVSAFRAPKYNLMLRKKGREVARDSQHTYGHAVDFRIPGVPTKRLVNYVRSLRVGGAGYYPESAFVHADTGPVRTWAGR